MNAIVTWLAQQQRAGATLMGVEHCNVPSAEASAAARAGLKMHRRLPGYLTSLQRTMLC